MLDEDADLGWLDYGFRNYDPQIGRFPQLDPLTFSYPFLTPYQYASCDPITNIDVDGLEGCPSVGGMTGYVGKAASAAGGAGNIFNGIAAISRIASPIIVGLNLGLNIVNTASQQSIVKQQLAGNSINGGFTTGGAGTAGHGPNAGGESPGSNPSQPNEDDNWKGFNKSDLEKYAKSLGYTVLTPKVLGNLMENIFYDWMSEHADSKINFRYNPSKIRANENSVPDFVSDNIFYETVTQKSGPFRKTIKGPSVDLPAADIFEVKASGGGIYLSSNDWQMEAHITNQSNRLLKYTQMGFVPTTSLVTTWDVTWSEGIANHALGLGINYTHFRAQYRIANGVYQFNFGMHDKAYGSKGFK